MEDIRTQIASHLAQAYTLTWTRIQAGHFYSVESAAGTIKLLEHLDKAMVLCAKHISQTELALDAA